MSKKDALHRFVFERLGIRGEFVQLRASWQAVAELHDYPPKVAEQLGQALVGVTLLSATIKFKGSLILQIQSDGPLNTLVTQATEERTLRGVARWRGEVPSGDLAQTYGSGRLVLTAESTHGERYQGIVELAGDCLGGALETYFKQSEQLPTRLWLFANETETAGLLLQRLPQAAEASQPSNLSEEEPDDDAWQRVCLLADTVAEDELLELDAQTLLRRLFHEETVRLFEPEPVSFRCGCTRQSVVKALRLLGAVELQDILKQEGEIAVACEFCNRNYHFDAVDVEQICSDTGHEPTSPTRH